MLKQQLADRRAAGVANEMRQAAAMVSEEIIRTRMQEMASEMAQAMSKQYQAVVMQAVTSIMDEVAKGISQLEKQLSQPPEAPQVSVDMSGVERVVSTIRESIDSIEFPAPEAAHESSPSPSSSGAREYRFDVERDGDGRLAAVIASPVEE